MGFEAPSRAQLPAKIGRYPVLGYLADGGMAEIFLGRDGAQAVVIKRILPHLARHQNFVSMFIDEARIGSLVHHPNVVETRELGQVGNDLFMVMEYLAGESISGLLRRATLRQQRLPFALGAYIIAEACAGLHAAHELSDEEGTPYGLVHRDVSPSNLFVTYDGEVKVLDFGVATAAHRLTRTATGQVKGKFSYMSPEQCLGEHVDRRTDIFALGIVLYELMTQHRLFKRANELLVLKAVTQEPIPLPSRRMGDYPDTLQGIAMRALSRDRSRRQSTALELREELLGAMRELGFTGDPRVALADIMVDLFPERIAEKRTLVRHVRSGTELPMIPAAEVDENVEMPQVDPRGTESKLAELTAIPNVRTGRGWAVFVVLLLLAVVGGAGWWLYTQRDVGPKIVAAPAPSAGLPPAPSPVPAPAVAAPAPVPADEAPGPVVVHIESIPNGATLLVDGERRGTTPFDLELPSPRRVALELQLEKHTPVRQELDLDRGQRLLIPLPELPATTTGEPADPPRRKSRKKSGDDPFQRFD